MDFEGQGENIYHSLRCKGKKGKVSCFLKSHVKWSDHFSQSDFCLCFLGRCRCALGVRPKAPFSFLTGSGFGQAAGNVDSGQLRLSRLPQGRAPQPPPLLHVKWGYPMASLSARVGDVKCCTNLLHRCCQEDAEGGLRCSQIRSAFLSRRPEGGNRRAAEAGKLHRDIFLRLMQNPRQ